MKRVLQKCIGPDNKSGFTFVEVMVVGVLVPMVVRNVKNYVLNTDRNNEDQKTYTT